MSNERTFNPASAARLDLAERAEWIPRAELARLLALHAGLRVADIGAGTGFLAIPFARAVAPGGCVHAVDLQPEMLELLRTKLDADGAALPIELQQGTAEATGLDTASCDLAICANVWHELDNVSDVLAEMRRILVAGGRLAILDWRADLDTPPGPPQHHRVARSAIEQTLAACGWTVTHAAPFGIYNDLVIARV